jgi:CDP-diacylglycerol---glycerol-3-phosphate 3-phosphatidyltransferase
MSLYALKPRFQVLLRPLTAWLARLGVTANAVTILATAASIAVGAIVAWRSHTRAVFLIIPLWLLARMAFNAIDGMLAREFHQKSVLGGYLNEIGDVVSDAALCAPFAFVPPFSSTAIVVVIVLSIVSEFAGVMGPLVGASRRYDGPLGKSDRAAVFGALGLWIGVAAPMPASLEWLMVVLAGLLVATTINRVRAGMREAAGAALLR